MLKNYIKKYDLLNKQQCKDVIVEHKNAPWQSHSWNKNADDSNSTKDYDPQVLYMDRKWAYVVYKSLETKIEDYFKTVSDGSIYTKSFSPTLLKDDLFVVFSFQNNE